MLGILLSLSSELTIEVLTLQHIIVLALRVCIFDFSTHIARQTLHPSSQLPSPMSSFTYFPPASHQMTISPSFEAIYNFYPPYFCLIPLCYFATEFVRQELCPRCSPALGLPSTISYLTSSLTTIEILL